MGLGCVLISAFDLGVDFHWGASPQGLDLQLSSFTCSRASLSNPVMAGCGRSKDRNHHLPAPKWCLANHFFCKIRVFVCPSATYIYLVFGWKMRDEIYWHSPNSKNWSLRRRFFQSHNSDGTAITLKAITCFVESSRERRIDVGQPTVLIEWCPTKSQGLMAVPLCVLGIRKQFEGEVRDMSAFYLLFILNIKLFHYIYLFLVQGIFHLKNYLTRIINGNWWNKGRLAALKWSLFSRIYILYVLWTVV